MRATHIPIHVHSGDERCAKRALLGAAGDPMIATMVRCSTCGAPAPEMSTIDTTWARYGWRVSRKVAANGDYVVDFYCPDCWKAKKAQPTTST